MKTKIYGTIGPACQDVDTLVHLFEKGMNGIRINLSHSGIKESEEWLENIKTAYEKSRHSRRSAAVENLQSAEEKMASGQQKQAIGMPEILMDLEGPELRLGKLLSDRELKEGEKLTLLSNGRTNLFDPTELPIPKLVIDHLTVGQQLLLDDGKILLEVEEFLQTGGERAAECTVLRGGTLKSGKSIALPGVKLHPPTLTENDRKNIALAKNYGITGVMLPFVREKEDLLQLKQALKEAGAEDIRIFAKIENMDGVEKLEELLPYCDEIVIARGDLGNAMPLWKLPVIQAEIAERCRANNKPFMVVTQMLASMERAKVPTRAEVSDIFRAVSEGAASVMVTGETAAGAYPIEVMEYLVHTAEAAERYCQSREIDAN